MKIRLKLGNSPNVSLYICYCTAGPPDSVSRSRSNVELTATAINSMRNCRNVDREVKADEDGWWDGDGEGWLADERVRQEGRRKKIGWAVRCRKPKSFRYVYHAVRASQAKVMTCKDKFWQKFPLLRKDHETTG